jgi:hypothetical protein
MGGWGSYPSMHKRGGYPPPPTQANQIPAPPKTLCEVHQHCSDQWGVGSPPTERGVGRGTPLLRTLGGGGRYPSGHMRGTHLSLDSIKPASSSHRATSEGPDLWSISDRGGSYPSISTRGTYPPSTFRQGGGSHPSKKSEGGVCRQPPIPFLRVVHYYTRPGLVNRMNHQMKLAIRKPTQNW